MSSKIPFVSHIALINIRSPTKRSVLSTIARIFDVLGLLSPIVIRLKIILHEIWIIQIGSDGQLPEDFIQIWFRVKEDLTNINKISTFRDTFLLQPIEQSRYMALPMLLEERTAIVFMFERQ